MRVAQEMVGTSEKQDGVVRGTETPEWLLCELGAFLDELGGVEWEVAGGGNGLLACVGECGTCIRKRKGVERRTLAGAQIEVDEAVERIESLLDNIARGENRLSRLGLPEGQDLYVVVGSVEGDDANSSGIFTDAPDDIAVMRKALVAVVHVESGELVRAEEFAGLRIVGVSVVGRQRAERNHPTLRECSRDASLAPEGDISGRRSHGEEAHKLGHAEGVEGIGSVDDD